MAMAVQANNLHSKMSGLVYKKLERAEYLRNPLFNSQGVKLLLALRTRTVTGIRYSPRIWEKNPTVSY